METVNAAGSDRPDSRPVYSFGKTAVEVETKVEEDWLVEMKKASQARIKKEKKSKSTVNSPEFTVKVEEITLSLYSESVE